MKKRKGKHASHKDGSTCVYRSSMCCNPLYIGLFFIFQISVFVIYNPCFARTGFGKGDYNLLPDTGQTGCVNQAGMTIDCSGTGQDGAWTGLPRSFSVLDPANNGENVVVDNNTGLMWMQGTADINSDGTIDYSDKLTYQDAIYYCATLSYAGFEDWRLPQIFELTTIADYNMYKPAFSLAIFYAEPWDPLSVNPAKYWSATLRKENADDMAWLMDFEYGRIYTYYSNVPYYVRCVRDGIDPSDDGFVDNGDQTVTDLQTGLVWTKAAAPDKLSWIDALDYCNTLSLAGQNDWRLPNLQELRSILNFAYGTEGIDQNIFSGPTDDGYWTSTSFENSLSLAWAVAFNGNGDSWFTKDYLFNVRCVRSGLGGPYHILSMSIVGNGTGRVTSTPPDIDCKTGHCSGPFQSQAFQDGTVVTLQATAAANSTLAGWGGDCSSCGTNTECQVVMDNAKQCTATFAIKQRYTLTISPKPVHGTITGNTNTSAPNTFMSSNGPITAYYVTNPPGLNCGSKGTKCTETYEPSILVRLTASSDDGYSFSGWSGDCAECGSVVTCDVFMNADKICGATFHKIGGIQGDVNGDSTLDIVDALFIARFAVGLSVPSFNEDVADVNCDGHVNIVDALFVARKAVGLTVNGWCWQ